MEDYQRLWHYTNGEALESILKSGALLPSLNQVPWFQKQAVWCSFNQVWEEAANRVTLQPSEEVCGSGGS